MVFSSNSFLFFFLPAILIVYYAVPPKYRNFVLLLGSLIFYGWGEPRLLILMMIVILINYFSACALKRFARWGKEILILNISLNLLILGGFKYSGFIVRNFNYILPGSVQFRIPDIALPIGISFYTFQSMSYVVDVYRGDVACQKNVLTFATYVSMFPQLIAGPIVRYRDVEAALHRRTVNYSDFASGVLLFLIGLSKKLLLANRMGEAWEALRITDGSFSAGICMMAYTLQIYFDFSGYSDMALGLGRMLGFRFPKNFDYPYISRSITEFWRRWHITLGSWFREYVYIPLGGNRYGQKRQVRNVLIVWLLTGLWHGASWNFVLWGLYYAFLLILEKTVLLKFLDSLPKAITILYVWVAVSFGWVLFSMPEFSELGGFLSRLIHLTESSIHEKNLILAYSPLMLLSVFCATPLPKRLYHMTDGRRSQCYIQIIGATLLLLLCTSSLASRSYNPFIYFRF